MVVKSNPSQIPLVQVLGNILICPGLFNMFLGYSTKNTYCSLQYSIKTSEDQILPLGSRESFTWIISKITLYLVLDFQGVFVYVYSLDIHTVDWF